jgi:hypothetical protein
MSFSCLTDGDVSDSLSSDWDSDVLYPISLPFIQRE